MELSPLAHELYEEISQLAIIDAHEHLPSEAEYLAFGYSGLNMFAGYIWHDLESAGLDPGFKATMRDGGDRPVAEWWPKIRSCWEQVKNTSYARALRITARDLFGLSEISDATIGELAARVQADNTPGLYRRVLQDRCRIRRTITYPRPERAQFPDDPGLCGITMLLKPDLSDQAMLAGLRARSPHPIKTLADAVEAVQAPLRADRANGAVGYKMVVSQRGSPDPLAAERELKEALRPAQGPGHFPALADYLLDKALDVAAEADLPVAVHTGVFGDFRELAPTHMFSFAMRRRDVRFDMFHLGMPMVREAAFMGKTLPNVTLNLTWCPIVSQVLTARMLAEIIDLVPVNKIIAFGGDYRVTVHKVYGHLVMAREVVAAALAERVEAGDFDREYALYLASQWFHDNPSRIYGV